MTRLSFLAEWERDPAAYVRRQFEALSAQNEREVAQTEKSKEERKYAAAYSARRAPNNPEAA